MAVPKKKTTNKSELRFPARDRDLPATQGMLQLVRTELKAEMKAGFKQVDARFNQLDARFNRIDSKFSQIDSRFNQVDARFNQMDSRFEQVLSEIARIGVLVEEQNSRNRVVMEGLTGLFQRQERVENRVDHMENLIHSIAARPRR